MSYIFYCIGAAMFTMFLHFGLGYNKEEKTWGTVFFFIFGAIVGWFFDGNYGIGFVTGVILSLLFW